MPFYKAFLLGAKETFTYPLTNICINAFLRMGGGRKCFLLNKENAGCRGLPKGANYYCNFKYFLRITGLPVQFFPEGYIFAAARGQVLEYTKSTSTSNSSAFIFLILFFHLLLSFQFLLFNFENAHFRSEDR